MSRIADASRDANEASSIFTDLAQAIGNASYSAEGYDGRFQKLAVTMAYVNKIGYATLPFYFRLKNRVETSLLAIGKLSKMFTGGGNAAGTMGDAVEGLVGQYEDALDIVTSGGIMERMGKSLNFVTMGLAGKTKDGLLGLGAGVMALGVGIKDFAKRRDRVQTVVDGLYAFGMNTQEMLKDFGSALFDKIKNIPLKAIFANLGAFLLVGLKAFFIITLGLTALLVLFKSKAVQNTAKRILATIIELGAVIFDALATVFEGFMLIFKALMGGEGFMKSLGMALKGVGKIFFGILKGLFGVAFVVLKGLLTVVVGAVYEVGKYIVDGVIFALKGSGKFLGNLLLPGQPFGSPFAMASGGVSSGGMTLVGEEGPELVRLPTGARVYSNQQSRRMAMGTTNNITVNVQGRIGASDTELRQIASKIGQMINKEVNRTTSSRGTLG